MLADLGSDTPWDDRNRGADVDANPLKRALQMRALIDQGGLLAPETQPATSPTTTAAPSPATAEALNDSSLVVNATDSARAEIVRRYRLFSHQPDEFITFAALGKMRPSEFDFDPRLYQYGGMWVYPVALMLKVASVVGYVDLRGGGGGLTYYLDHPEAFGRFYVVARLYSVTWGLVGVAAIFAIVRRISGSPWAAVAAGLLFAAMPVVVNAAHEAKPHLAGLSLTLLAVLAAATYVETGKLAHAIAAGVLSGLALGMVLSALPVFAILPLMAMLRPMSWGDRIRVAIFSGLVGLVAYGVTNPYVAIHLLRGGEALRSNLGNSKAFYYVHEPVAGVINVGRLIVAGTSPALAITGVLGTIVLGIRAIRTRKNHSPEAIRRRAHGLLLAAPAVLTAIQWALVGAGKPAEFGRFLLTTDAFLVVEAVVLLKTCLRSSVAAGLIYSAVLLQTAWTGGRYVAGFVRDSSSMTSRIQAAEMIDQARRSGISQVILAAEPAPYAVPPMNLWELQLLLPSGEQPPADGGLQVRTLDGRTPISWADKPIDVRPTR